MFHRGGVNAPHARWAGECLAWYGHPASGARRWRCSPVASLAGELSARSAALVPRRSSVVCSWLVRRRRRALWAVVSVRRVLVRLTIDAAACRVRLCLRVRVRAAVVSAGYLSVCPAIDTVASRRVRSRLLGSGGSLGSEADAAIVGGIQWAEPRHVGGAPGSAARLSVGRALLIARAIVSGLVLSLIHI